LARRHQIFQQTMVRALHDQLLYPFHVQHVQALQPPVDYERRRAFCEWLLQQDAACFTQNGILNTCNQHTWADENPHSLQETNPHSLQETQFQHQFAINVWAGINGDLLMSYRLDYQGTPIYSSCVNNCRNYWQREKQCGYSMIGLLPILLATSCGI
jgi:hypothetical protein